jgi:hypothetical protein
VTRRDYLLVAALLAGAGVLLAALGGVDAFRARGELERMERAVCGAQIDRAAVEALAPLLSEPGSVKQNGDPRIVRVLDTFGASEWPQLFFEHQSTLWVASRHGCPWSGGAQSWPQKVGRWEHVAWSEGCRAVRDGTRLVVARTFEVAPGRFAVAVVTRRRG